MIDVLHKPRSEQIADAPTRWRNLWRIHYGKAERVRIDGVEIKDGGGWLEPTIYPSRDAALEAAAEGICAYADQAIEQFQVVAWGAYIEHIDAVACSEAGEPL